jgi:hypothetical protein
MLKVSLCYFLTEFAGGGYNLTGFKSGITRYVRTGQVFFVHGFIQKKGELILIGILDAGISDLSWSSSHTG